jgi:phosphoglycerate dehydrogenase-like enzyme
MKHVMLDLTIDPQYFEPMRRIAGLTVHVVGPTSSAIEKATTTAVERPAEMLRQMHALVCKFPPQNIDDLTSLEMMQLVTVGHDHLARYGLGDRPYTVCNARGAFDTGISEWNAAMMVNLTRNLRGMIRNQERGYWERAEQFQQELRGKIVGLWGYGGLGRETARVAKALGLVVHVLSRRGVGPRLNDFTPKGTGDPEGTLPDRVFLAGQEREFLSALDFLILALPRTKATTGMIGEKELQALPRSAFVLNPARGPIIQEAALIRALEEGWIAGAALDTHYYYPMPPEHPLWKFPNVIMTPHVSGADKSWRFPGLISELVTENLTRFATGRPLLNVVSREELRES